MQPIVIDGEGLIIVLESNDPDGRFYLDRETGEVHVEINEAVVGVVEGEEIDFTTERFVLIEPVPSYVGWRIMRNFIESLPAGPAAMQLAHAIEGKSAFRRFKDVLLNYPKLREQWFQFHADAFYTIAEAWLRDAGIEAVLHRRQAAR